MVQVVDANTGADIPNASAFAAPVGSGWRITASAPGYSPNSETVGATQGTVVIRLKPRFRAL